MVSDGAARPQSAASASRLWNPATGRFDPAVLREAIVSRRWTAEEFALAARIGRTTVYKALNGEGVRDRTAIAILDGLARRRPKPDPGDARAGE
jgi:predicted transcriptional regulator